MKSSLFLPLHSLCTSITLFIRHHHFDCTLSTHFQQFSTFHTFPTFQNSNPLSHIRESINIHFIIISREHRRDIHLFPYQAHPYFPSSSQASSTLSVYLFAWFREQICTESRRSARSNAICEWRGVSVSNIRHSYIIHKHKKHRSAATTNYDYMWLTWCLSF